MMTLAQDGSAEIKGPVNGREVSHGQAHRSDHIFPIFLQKRRERSMVPRIRDQHFVAISVNDDIVKLQQGALEVGHRFRSGAIVKRRTRKWNDIRAPQITRAPVVRSVVDNEQRRSRAMRSVVPHPNRQIHMLIVHHGNDRDITQLISPTLSPDSVIRERFRHNFRGHPSTHLAELPHVMILVTDAPGPNVSAIVREFAHR
jgi:hypothetical protein